MLKRVAILSGLAMTYLLVLTGPASASGAAASNLNYPTTTPIKHLVVVFQENVSFDHYFGTYPYATNQNGEPFTPAPGTPSVNGLTPALLTHNPNGVNPHRLGPNDALVCDQNHDYTPEQAAFDHGLMDKFPENTQVTGCSAPDKTLPGLVMDYYDGNTVTAMWNYAQHFALNDNSYGTTFGPSTPGALNLVSGQTHGAVPAALPGVVDNDTVIGDADPTYDDCSSAPTISMQSSNKNIGELLTRKDVTWGWFEGGFAPTSYSGGKAVCGSSHTNIGGAVVADYSAHHEPFQYYKATSNPHHLAPASEAEIGHNGRANHQYDLRWFYTALKDGNLPAVSFVKAARYQDGHAGYSDPIDEQHFLVKLINSIEESRFWSSTAIVIAYDDSDGWYDHQMSTVVNDSQSSDDVLTDPGQCGTNAPMGGYQDRCGYGPRLPLLVISPYSRVNFVDNTLTDQSSILRFIEDNWLTGHIGDNSFDGLAGPLSNMFDFSHRSAHKLILNPRTGSPV